MLILLLFGSILRTFAGSIPAQCINPTQYICSSTVINNGADFTRCSDGAGYDPACQGGFFDSEYRTNETAVPPSIGYSVPCCPGYYCSRTTACMQPCSKGSWCTLSVSDEGYCFPYSLPNSTGHCGGALVDFPCPDGNYCPTSMEIQSCSSGHYCPSGSTQQYKCTGYFSRVNQLDYCGDNTAHDQFRGRNVFWAVFIILFLLAVFSIRNFFLGSVQKQKPKEFENMNNLVSALNGTDSFLNPMPDQIEVSQIEINDIKVWRNGKMDFSKTLDGNEEMILKAGVTAIIGLSGAGKSTLLETLVGKMDFYYHLDAKITVSVNAETKILDYQKEFFPMYGNFIAYVPQDDIFHQPLTVWETVLFSCRLRTNYSVKQCREFTAYWLLKLGLSKDEDWMKLTTSLSGGMKKRVNVAMELVTDPRLLILDEPTSGLDTKTTESLLIALKEFSEGKAFTVSPDVNEVLPRRFSTRIVIAVIHQPSYEVSEKFHYILGVKKISNIGVFDLPFYEWSILQNKYSVNSPRRNFMDSYVLDLVEQEAKFSIEDTRTFDLGCCESRTYYPISLIYFSSKHFIIGCERGFVLFFRRLWEFFVYTTLALCIGGLLGYVTKQMQIQTVPAVVFLLLLVTSLICMQTGFQLRQSNQKAYERERGRGVHAVSIYLADTFVDFVAWLFFVPFYFLLLFFPFAVPRGSFMMYYGVLLCVAFTASGIGQAICELGLPASVGIYLNLFFAVLCGFAPPKPELAGFWKISFLSFPFEALVNGEYLYYPPVFDSQIQFTLSQALQQCTVVTAAVGTDATPVLQGSCEVGYDTNRRAGLLMLCILIGFIVRLIPIFLQIWKLVGLTERLQLLLKKKKKREVTFQEEVNPAQN